MAAELVRPGEEGEDEWERPLSDEELQAAEVGKVFWNPEEEYAENPFVVQKALHRLPAKARVRPSKFAEYGFYYPSDDLSYKPFTFEGRRHMKRIYDTSAKRLLLICGRQVEKSTLIGNIALTYMCMVPGYRVLYVSPSATQTKTFSADRIREPLETSPVLKRFTTRMLSSNILEKQFVNRSRITLRYAYLNADRTRGIPAWQLSLDELQDILAENIPVIEQCLAHAPERWKRFIYSGTPKSLDNTIEYYRDRFSTQGEWVVPCDGCGSNAKGAGGRYWNVLGEKNIGRKSLICDRCGKEITPMHPDAQWARMVKEAAFESFHIPQLMVPWKPYNEILLDYERYPRDKFYNEVLGISFDGGLRPLTTGQVQANCNPDLHMVDYENYRQLSYSQPFFMGLDWGTGENSYTVLTLATYINMRFRVIFAHRFTGQDTSPEIQLEKIMEIINYFNVAVVGTDYGGGFDRNDWLIRRLGNRRVWKYQYISRPKRKLEWDTKLGRFKVHRTEIMSDVLNAIKRTSNKVFEFPRWEDFKDPFAQDMLNIYSEYNETLKLIQYQHSVDKPDDTFHSLLYCFLASMLVKPRPDVIIPRKEDKRGFGLQTYGSPGGTLDQG